MVLVPSIAATLAMALSLTPMAVFGHPGEKYGKREALEEMGNAHVVNKMNARALEACQNSPAVKARKERASMYPLEILFDILYYCARIPSSSVRNYGPENRTYLPLSP